jgi:prevent-host-death family protein
MTTTTVGAYEAKTHLPRLLAQVENGDEVVITKHGRPVARLVPIAPGAYDVAELVVQMRELRESIAPIGIPLRELLGRDEH